MAFVSLCFQPNSSTSTRINLFVSTWSDPEAAQSLFVSGRAAFRWKLCYNWLNGLWRIYHDDVIKWKHFPRFGPVVMGMPSHRPVTRGFDIFFDLCLNKRLSEQSKRWWYKTPSRSLWSHCNVTSPYCWAFVLTTKMPLPVLGVQWHVMIPHFSEH